MIDQASTAAFVAAPARVPKADWRTLYARRLVFTDVLALVWVVFGTQIAWFGLDSANVAFRGNLTPLALNYTVISISLIVAWTIMLGIFSTRDYRVLGMGSDEYKRIATSSLRLFGLIAIVAYLFQIDLARGYILIAFPLGVVTLIFSRWIWRQWLAIERKRGNYSSTVLLVGSSSSAIHISRELARQPQAGYRVVGACVYEQVPPGLLEGTDVPVLGSFDDVHCALETTGADTVVITSSQNLPPERVRRLSWSLEPGRQHLVVAPNLIDVGGPRIHTRPVSGLPLIHVETPTYDGRKRFTKRLFDILVSSVLIVILSPFLAFIAVLVKASSPGSVLFRQERVGVNGVRFRMLKFRSMVDDAEQRLAPLQGSRDAGNAILFKLKDDPRVTPIGRFLRRFSLDELPQLFNVVRGQMSVVGPRPPLADEVDRYESDVHRRFLVKPGVTGLWQVSGRSNLSWEDSVRLDLYYVENWSLVSDVLILARTARAVLTRDGAY